ncbi:MAG: hypothetical protein HF978_08440 [Desulfobacteraceae bacterium]|nr:hypothetical protein [Desulfobacteraceae bacterium]MBC2755559.1 hypothetical protein [Desulfobacteraceae bacterium]
MSTFFINGIEFVLPGIFKAYPREWAEQFLKKGTIYFTNLVIFQRDEDFERGDPLESTSVTIRQGVRCTADYLNPIFVFCSTMESDPNIVLSTWRDRDTVLQITDTLSFINRIKDAVVERKIDIRGMQVGPVTYDKDAGSRREYHWVEGIFQKSMCYTGQKEFRIALVGDVRIKCEEHIVLTLGDCSDIARIMESPNPNHAMHPGGNSAAHHSRR